MNDADLRGRLAEAILDGLGPTRLDEPGGQLELVARVRDADLEIGALLQQAVNSARSSGQSWSALGATLGMSRQAAQQRFGRSEIPAVPGEPVEPGKAEQRWLGPVTAFDEMHELELAGRLGWRTVGARLFYHLIEKTPTQWQHRRTVWAGPVRRLEKDGWQLGVLAFPWVYLVRDTGLPAEE